MKKIITVVLGACFLLLAMQSCNKKELFVPVTKNPVVKEGLKKSNWIDGVAADPFITYYNGTYYLIYNKDWNHVTMRTGASILDLANAPDQYIYSSSQNPSGIANGIGGGSWLYHYNSKWYLFGQGDDGNVSHSKCFVLESTGDSPAGPYNWKATFSSPSPDGYGYASSPLLVGSQMYLTQTSGGKIWLSTMSNPWTLTSGWNLISAAGSSGWECANGRCLDEGGSLVVKNGKAFLIFEAGGYESPDYCVGMITALTTSNLLLQSSWNALPKQQVFSRNNTAGAYGPGSMTFFKSPDGTEDWVVYHIKTTTALGGEDRRLQYKKITWDGSGNPVFGQPRNLDEYYSTLPSGDPGLNPTSGKYEAESAVAANCTSPAVRSSIYASGGSYVGGIDNSNSTVTFTVNVPVANGAGIYPLRVWYDNGTGGTSTHLLSVNGAADITVNYPQTGAWARFPSDQYTMVSVRLNTGNNTLVFKKGAGFAELDKIQLDLVGTADGITGASRGAGILDVFVLNSSNIVRTRAWHTVGGWGGWGTPSGGAPAAGLAGVPSAVSRNSSQLDIVSVGRDGNVYTLPWVGKGSGWQSWISLGHPTCGVALMGSAVAARGTNNLDVYVLGADRQVWSRATTDGGVTWGSWFTPYSSSVMKFNSAPAAVSKAANSLDVFALGSDGIIWNTYWDGSIWHPWGTGLGAPPGGALSAPVVTSSGAYDMELYVRGGYYQVWKKTWLAFGGGWGDWELVPSTGGPSYSTSAQGATSQKSSTQYDIFTRFGTTTYTTSWNGTAWASWTNLGTP